MQSTIDIVRVPKLDIVQEAIADVRRERLQRRYWLLDKYLGDIMIPLKAGGALSFILFWSIGISAPVLVAAAYVTLYLPVCAIARANAERALGWKVHPMAASVMTLAALGLAVAAALAPMAAPMRAAGLVVAGLAWLASAGWAAVRGEWSR